MKFRVSIMMAVGIVCACNSAFGFAVRGLVVANGGASSSPASNGTHQLFGTVGQACVSGSQSAGWTACSGFWCFGGSRVLAVNPSGKALPTEFALGMAMPNPNRGEARFALKLPRAAIVTLTVYDVSGRQIGDGISQPFDAGEHELLWRAPSARAGVYFVRIGTDGNALTKRTIVVMR